MTITRGLGLREARITGGFWLAKVDMVAGDMLPYQWKALNDEVPGAEPSHAVENFRIAAGESTGEFHGTVFQDSDVAKWLEAASYSLVHHPDAVLEAKVDEIIRLIAKAQAPDGYVNTYFLVMAPDKRWQDLAWGHELYCAGHLIEAAVAHNASTGKTTLLDVAKRYADCIDRAFGA
ncbi:MAG: glycoside hydrolase family 127 protein, partial [Spirochaetaceae bacterium]|nr:glycoside hydrolase family 127 protein [Spirochaetaceae bacterium]